MIAYFLQFVFSSVCWVFLMPTGQAHLHLSSTISDFSSFQFCIHQTVNTRDNDVSQKSVS